MADQVAGLTPWTWWFEIHTDRFLLWEVRQTRCQIYPPGHGHLRFIMIDSYSESSGRQDGRSSGRSTPPKSKFRLILINSYSESSGRWGGRSTPTAQKMAIWDTDRLPLWELRQTRWQIKWQIYPPWIWWFEIHTDRFLLWELRQTRWEMYPPGHGDLRFILIDSYSESSGRQDGRSSGRSTPLKASLDWYW